MASIGGSSQAKVSGNSNEKYGIAVVLMCTLFFMIGFITVLNDVLIPAMKEIFNFSKEENWKVILIQFCFFTAYGVMSIPGGAIIHKVGYKKGLGIALSIIGAGLLMFIPAAEMHSYPFFLFALFVVGSGLAILQVAINPYLAALGDPAKAASRVNLGGTLNSTATAVGPIIGAWLILDSCVHADEKIHLIKNPYLILALIILGIAALLFFINLPKLHVEEDAPQGADNDSIWRYKHLMYGAAAIFFYVGAEVAIGSFLVNYLKDDYHITEALASGLVAYYWGSAMIGRAIGTFITSKFDPAKLLAFVAVVSMILVTASLSGLTMDHDITVPVLQMGNNCDTHAFEIGFVDVTIPFGVFCLIMVGLFNSVMWPIIFPLGIAKLGALTSKGSGLMVTMVIGGAIVPQLQSFLIGGVGYQMSFAMVLICYAYILFFAVKGSKTDYLNR